MRSILYKKKAAIELSMTTVVVIVLAMTMLALGLTLVRTLFKGAIYTAQSLGQSTQNEINKIFTDEQKDLLLVGPPSRQLRVCPNSQPYIHYYLNTKNGGAIKLTVTTSAIPQQQAATCSGVEKKISVMLSVPPSQTYGQNIIQKTDTVQLNVPATVPVGCSFYLTLTADWNDGAPPSADSMTILTKGSSIAGCTSD
jgi:hypothetical protein